MSDNINPTVTPAQAKRWYRPRNLLLATAVVLTAGTAGAFLQSVSAQGMGPFGGSGFGPGGWHGRMMGGPMMGRSLDPATIEDHVDRMVRHVGVEVDATGDQTDKLRAIAKAAVKDLVPMRAKADAARERAHALLVQPTISRADIEAFRTEQMQAADAFTKRVAQAIGDAADVLTLEQRKKLEELIETRHARWQGWHRG